MSKNSIQINRVKKYPEYYHFFAYDHNRLPLDSCLEKDIGKYYLQQLEKINTEAYAWMTRAKDKTALGICGYSMVDILKMPSFLHFLWFRCRGLLSSCRIVKVVYGSKVLESTYANFYENKSVRITSAENLKNCLRRFVLDWIKCQVIVNSSMEPLLMSLTDITGDLYQSKQSYIKACGHNGLLILDFPESISNNKQNMSMLQDLLFSRSKYAPTLLTCDYEDCKYRGYRDPDDSKTMSKDTIAMLNELSEIKLPVLDFNKEFNIFYSMSYREQINMLKRIMALDGWCEYAVPERPES